MKTRVSDLLAQGNKLFDRRKPMLPLWQTIAENFYPLRADFTTTRSIGSEFASHLMTGRPVMAHRELSNSLSSMLRPRGRPWFRARTGNEKINSDTAARQWLDNKSDVMRLIMYDRRAGFVRSTKEGDGDFAAFGQAVISVDPNQSLDGLLYRAWHLRDCAWCEDSSRIINVFHRDWSIEAREYVNLFPKTASQKIIELAKKEPYKEIKCRHIVMPGDQYDLNAQGRRLPFVSIYVDIENDTLLEEVPARTLNYVIPRWFTIAGSQYAYSPATTIALPDARLLQQITLTLLEAGQKAVDPPLKATREAIVGGVNTFAGGITWTDAEYDERQGSALEPLTDGAPGLNWGVDREDRIAALIKDAFFLDKLNLPDVSSGDMTAYEVQKRVEEYIRAALPLFEPMEEQYNGGLCELTWEHSLAMGAFGTFEDMPPILRGSEINWQFESPLQSANERAKTQAFMETSQLLATAVQADPSSRYRVDIGKAFSDALLGSGAPVDWVVPAEQAQALIEADQKAAALSQMAAVVGQGAQLAQDVGKAGQELQAAGVE